MKQRNKNRKGKQQGQESASSKETKQEGIRFVKATAEPSPSSPAPPPALPLWPGSQEDFDSEGLFCMGALFQAQDVPPPDVVDVGVQGKTLKFVLDNGAGWVAYLPGAPRPPSSLAYSQGFHCLGGINGDRDEGILWCARRI